MNNEFAQYVIRLCDKDFHKAVDVAYKRFFEERGMKPPYIPSGRLLTEEELFNQPISHTYKFAAYHPQPPRTQSCPHTPDTSPAVASAAENSAHSDTHTPIASLTPPEPPDEPSEHADETVLRSPVGPAHAHVGESVVVHRISPLPEDAVGLA